MLAKCVECKFYVRQADEFCLNCGFHYPAIKFQEKKFNLKKFLLIEIPVFAVTLAIVVIHTSSSEFQAPYIFICLLFNIIVSLVINLFLGIFEDEKVFVKRKSANKNNFIEKEKIIYERGKELGERGMKIDAVLDKIKDTDSPQLQDVRVKLFSAREMVISQFARYELQKQKIELVRLQNGVSPYLSGLHRLNDFETENGLLTIETTKTEIERIRHGLTRYDAIEFSAKVQPERENFLSQLTETVDSCDKLREAILSRQAVRALRDISPIEESLKLPDSKDLAHAADTFNIETTLTDFGESFEELEREYKRLRMENEVSHDILDG